MVALLLRSARQRVSRRTGSPFDWLRRSIGRPHPEERAAAGVSKDVLGHKKTRLESRVCLITLRRV